MKVVQANGNCLGLRETAELGWFQWANLFPSFIYRNLRDFISHGTICISRQVRPHNCTTLSNSPNAPTFLQEVQRLKLFRLENPSDETQQATLLQRVPHKPLQVEGVLLWNQQLALKKNLPVHRHPLKILTVPSLLHISYWPIPREIQPGTGTTLLNSYLSNFFELMQYWIIFQF